MSRKNKELKKILVIGESARDVFVYCDANRLAPDLPIPVLNVIDQTTNPAMASNLEKNIKSLMKDCDIVTNENWVNITKTRYVHKGSNHTFLRVDTDNKIPRIDIKKVNFEKYFIVAISDYNKGFLSEEDIRYICARHKRVFIDTKKVLGDFINDAMFIKINKHEFERSKNNISTQLKNKIIVTKGESGAVYRNKIFPVKKVEVKDVTGAGDSFFAALLVKYFQTENIEKSIIFANKCASEVVKHRGVTLIH